MTLFITEEEMSSRLIDNLKKAATRAEEFMKVDGNKRLSLFTEFVNSIKVSAGCSHQLAHARHDQSPYWLEIRDKLESIIDLSSKLPIFSQEQGYLWTKISSSLVDLSKGVETLYNSKALPFATIDKMLQHRLDSLPKDG